MIPSSNSPSFGGTQGCHGSGQGGQGDDQKLEELKKKLEQGNISAQELEELKKLLKAKGMSDEEINNFIQSAQGGNNI